MTLKDLEIGKSAVIRQVGGKGALRQHFLDMGIIPGAEVTVVSELGGNLILHVKESRIALDKTMAMRIMV